MPMRFCNYTIISDGFAEEIPDEQKDSIFGAIGRLSDLEEVDYLQVFELRAGIDYETGEAVQRIIHTQDDPDYRKEYILYDVEELIDQTVFVIDSEDHHTYLLAREY